MRLALTDSGDLAKITRIQYAFARVNDPSVSLPTDNLMVRAKEFSEQARQVRPHLVVRRGCPRIPKRTLPQVMTRAVDCHCLIYADTQSSQVSSKFLKGAHLVLQARSDVSVGTHLIDYAITTN